MSHNRRQFLRDNAFLVAAVTLPVAVAGFFLLATAIPQWTVPPPAYDLLLRVSRSYDGTGTRVLVNVAVRNGHVEATVRLPEKDAYVERWGLFLFEHTTGTVREIQIPIPDDLGKGESRTIPIPELAGRRVTSEPRAPDGYELSHRNRGGGGLVGELFGMGRYETAGALMNRGRVVSLQLPSSIGRPYWGQVVSVGWIVDEPRRVSATLARGWH